MKLKKNGTNIGAFPELRGSIASLRWPCFAEIKYDGEACIICYDEKAETPILTTNKYGTMRYDWDKLNMIMDILSVNDVTRAVLLAELYHGYGGSGALYQLLSNKDSDDLNIKIYDAGFIADNEGEMEGTTTSLITRKEKLEEIFKCSQELLVHSKVIYNKGEAEKYFQAAILGGYEGIVLKPFDGHLTNGPCNWVKMKFKDRTAYKVINISSTQERIEVAVPSPSNPMLLVGVKVVNKYKKDLKPGDMVVIEHQGVLDSGSLRHPVFCGLEGGEEA